MISPIFPYDFRRSLGASENGRAEQSDTDLEVAADKTRFGDASTQRFIGIRLDLKTSFQMRMTTAPSWVKLLKTANQSGG